MKDRPDAILRPHQATYLEGLLPPRDELRREMEAHAAEHDVPISDPEVGLLLSILARASRATSMLEIGAAIGYGALCLLDGAVPAARLTTIDVDPERLRVAGDFLGRAGLADRVTLVEGDALEVVPRLSGRFGLVYIDAVKTDYRRYLDHSLPLVELGGLVVLDNLLWKGHVANPPSAPDPDADALRTFNGYFVRHPQLEATVLPVGDGLGVGVKTTPTVMERGGPY